MVTIYLNSWRIFMSPVQSMGTTEPLQGCTQADQLS